MRTKEANQLEALRNVQVFLDANRDRLPAIVTSGTRCRLDESLARLAQHADDQASSAASSRNCTQRYHALRRRLLRSHLVPIALIARTTQPPLSELEQFRIPRGKPTSQQLAAAAHAMADAAAPHADTFVAAGLPANFIEQLQQASEAMTSELAARAQEWARHRVATEALRAGIASARRIVKVLDAFVRSACEYDEGMIAGWESVTHVRRSAHRAATSPEIAYAPPVRLVVTEVPAADCGERLAQGTSTRWQSALRRRALDLIARSGRARLAAQA